MHKGAFNFVRGAVDAAGRSGTALHSVVEFGGRDINGSVRPLFRSAKSYVSIDLIPGPGVDVVADATTYAPPESVDCVVCCEVLEHSPDPGAIVANALRILRDDGLLIVTCATSGRAPHSAITGGPLIPGEYYSNVGILDLDDWLRPGAAQVEYYVDNEAHDLYCVALR